MKVRVVKNFANYRVGQEFDWASGMARVMIARGLIEAVVEPESPEVEEAVEPAAPQLERAVHQPRRKPKR